MSLALVAIGAACPRTPPQTAPPGVDDVAAPDSPPVSSPSPDYCASPGLGDWSPVFHRPITDQEAGFPVPITARWVPPDNAPSGASFGPLYLHYRPVGESRFRAIRMVQSAGWFYAEIPCATPEPLAWEYVLVGADLGLNDDGSDSPSTPWGLDAAGAALSWERPLDHPFRVRMGSERPGRPSASEPSVESVPADAGDGRRTGRAPELRIPGFPSTTRPDGGGVTACTEPVGIDALPDDPDAMPLDGFYGALGLRCPPGGAAGGCPGGAETRFSTDDDDGDTVPNAGEGCPCLPEDRDGFEDEDGCPDDDNDGDRVADVDDDCPVDPEVYQGIEDRDGCPDQAHDFAFRGPMVILDKVWFTVGSARIDDAGEETLRRVASILTSTRELELLEVQGHADPAESRGANLSDRRATAVADRLAELGVNRGRLLQGNFGSACPLDVPSGGNAGRVEFRVLWWDGRPTGVERSCRMGREFEQAIPARFVAPAPPPETCDGTDEDGDGCTDEGLWCPAAQSPPGHRGIRAGWMAAADDGWAVGDSAVLRWLGAAWDRHGSQWAARDVAGLSSSDVWIVGANGRIEHRDGRSERVFRIEGDPELRAVWAVSPDEAWAAGAMGVIVRWDGTEWRRVRSPTTEWLLDLWGSAADDVWAVGTRGTIIHWDGAAWSAVKGAPDATLRSIHGFARDAVWVVGDFVGALRWDGATWAVTDVGDAGTHFGSTWGAAADDLWAAGSGTQFRHWDGTTWTSVADVICLSGQPQQLWQEQAACAPEWLSEPVVALWGTTGADVWAAVQDGGVLRWRSCAVSVATGGPTEGGP
ncbi:MAG: OmpA family protein [Deltaproteobacteria bacterium]|nr:OmpA family protein [Deltaproteobacteria bacterium]